jgi:hypothetical protein
MALYVRAIRRSRHGTPKQFARRCADNGLKWIALGGPWHDRKGERWINSPETIKRYADALSNAEVKPHIWFYPWHDSIERIVDQVESCLNGSIVGVLPDPELGLKKKRAAAALLMSLLRERFPYMTVGFTSYGLPRGHYTFPWSEFAEPDIFDPMVEADYGSPQLYDEKRSRIIDSIEAYQQLGFDRIVPSYGLYTWVPRDKTKRLSRANRKAVPMSVGQFDAHMHAFVDVGVPIEAMIGWAENFATRPLWARLAEWAERMERGVFKLDSM